MKGKLSNNATSEFLLIANIVYRWSWSLVQRLLVGSIIMLQTNAEGRQEQRKRFLVILRAR
jgi:hypothetical protein